MLTFDGKKNPNESAHLPSTKLVQVLARRTNALSIMYKVSQTDTSSLSCYFTFTCVPSSRYCCISNHEKPFYFPLNWISLLISLIKASTSTYRTLIVKCLNEELGIYYIPRNQ